MDIQKMVDAMSASMRGTRSDYHVTLGSLIKILEGSDITSLVTFSDGKTPGSEDSYRGYYSDLAFDNSDEPKTVAQFLEQVKKALDKSYTGYKGGDFIMDASTPLWRAEYGSCGEAIISAQDIGGKLILITKQLD